ncbi:MAG: DUF4198 domain-containing protein [Bacteroidia bacterium]|nr:DUF4198 domain-containing protein [Bacteroidia bacterium]
MKRKFGALFLLLAITVIAMSHEFWLQPRKYTYQPGEEMIVDFMVGESFTGEFWDLDRHKVEKLEMHNLIGKRDMLKDVKATKGKNYTYKFSQSGTHMLVLQSDAAYIELAAEKFNDYLKEDGLDYILDERKESGMINEPSKENYTRFAKLLVQSGNRTDDTFKKKVGLRLEIIPTKNPYTLTSGDYLQCQVLFEGKPSPHTLVKVWSHIGEKIFLQNIYTENDGNITFPISNKGPWMVSSVKMIHSAIDPANYHSLWSSLVFGIE